MDLREELKNYIKANDAQGLANRLTKRGRPRRGTRAITQDDKNRCLKFALPEASLEIIDTLIRYGARLTFSASHAAVKRQEPALLELFIEWGWEIGSTQFGPSAVQSVHAPERERCS
jgi:hypothetical protein